MPMTARLMRHSLRCARQETHHRWASVTSCADQQHGPMGSRVRLAHQVDTRLPERWVGSSCKKRNSNMGKLVYPRPCCACGHVVAERSTNAVPCEKCKAHWDSFIGEFGGAF